MNGEQHVLELLEFNQNYFKITFKHDFALILLKVKAIIYLTSYLFIIFLFEEIIFYLFKISKRKREKIMIRFWWVLELQIDKNKRKVEMIYVCECLQISFGIFFLKMMMSLNFI